jgi:superfamily II DNA or RNA helicase
MQEHEILLVRQRHEAERAGLHFDYRIVIGDKAYSWATKKDLPKPGKSIILHEQPVHDTAYALSKKVVIPKGQYGAGVTTLDKVWKGIAHTKDGEYHLKLKGGERFLIKHMPKYGEKQWLFFNITGIGQDKKAGVEEEIYPQGKAEPRPSERGIEMKDSEDEFRSILLRAKAFTTAELKEKNPSSDTEIEGKESKPMDKRAYIQAVEPQAKPAKKLNKQEDQAQAQRMDNTISGQKHQNRVVEKLKTKHPRLMAFHGLGSGKTLTGLMAARQAQKEGKNVIFITPAGLTKNIEKEQKKHKIQLDKKRTKTLSYEMAVKKRDELMEDAKNDMVILDEAHKLRNEESTRFKELSPLLEKSPNVLMLSGSPLYNEPKNLSTLVNTLAKDKVLPENAQDFEQQFINRKTINPGIFKRLFLGVKPSSRAELKNQAYLKNVLDQYIDYYEPGEKGKAFYPKVNETEVKVPMSPEQQKVYDFLEGSLPGHVKWMVRMGLPPDKKTSKDLNAFASGLRQASNSAAPFKRGSKPGEHTSPKIERAASNLIKRLQEDKNFRGIVYSNYLKAGVEPYAELLNKLGVKYEVISGELPMRKRNQVVKNYNGGKTKVILLSSAGGEGLDLKGTKLIQVLEPHWNKEKINQVIGRGVRYKSHTHLPPEEQKVEVEHYMSTTRQTAVDKLFGVNPKSMDEYLRDRMNDKDQFNEQIKDVLRKQNDREEKK